MEFVQERNRLYLGAPLMVSFDVYPRVLTYLVLLVPALIGVPLIPTKLFPCLQLIYIFARVFIHWTIMYHVLLLAEMKVVFRRLKV